MWPSDARLDRPAYPVGGEDGLSSLSLSLSLLLSELDSSRGGDGKGEGTTELTDAGVDGVGAPLLGLPGAAAAV